MAPAFVAIAVAIAIAIPIGALGFGSLGGSFGNTGRRHIISAVTFGLQALHSKISIQTPASMIICIHGRGWVHMGGRQGPGKIPGISHCSENTSPPPSESVWQSWWQPSTEILTKPPSEVITIFTISMSWWPPSTQILTKPPLRSDHNLHHLYVMVATLYRNIHHPSPAPKSRSDFDLHSTTERGLL